MEKRNVVKEVLFLPERFYNEGNISIYQLLKDSGYFEFHNQISETDILKELIQHIQCIDLWLSWSENKRSSSGWYFTKKDNGKYVVGYFPLQANLKPTEYNDKTEACSVFIKQELEDIRRD